MRTITPVHAPATDRPRRRHPLRRASVAALATVGLLALGGCMKVDWDMTLHEDDTASGTVIMGFSDELAESMGMDPQELWDMSNEGGDSFTEGMPEGSTEQPYSDGEYTGVEVTFTDQPISEMAGGAEDELSVTREGDEFVVDGVFDLSEDAADMGDTGDLPEGLLDSFDMRIAVTFPGEVTETTGEVEGTTVVWTPTFGQVTEVYARGSAVGDGAAAPEEGATDEPTEDADEGTTGTGDDVADAAQQDDAGFPWWIVGLVLGLAVLGVVVALVVRNNRRPGPPAAGAPGSGPAPYAAGGVPPGYGQPQQPAPPVVPPQQTAPQPYPPPYQGPAQQPPAGPQQPPAGPQQPPQDPDGTPPAAPR
ncbi:MULTISPECIES: hypothetical protein [unclassified Isoptericola]|uniref:LppM family (lipo)protein n=1 Tax=unclassified Isoptericola TaxID=2623355 RepID=UPI0027143D8D|nr:MULTISPECIES: hypothetical protein [unclassified Isoptericola]MDO8147345.1 hypothetical protein [Isoptericola sp. b515]MDO8150338.1 hypothetical protein [Isoptericola sp. b408]